MDKGRRNLGRNILSDDTALQTQWGTKTNDKNGYFSIKRKDLIKFLEIAVEIGKKSQTYVEEIEEELGASGTIEYGFKLGDMTITEREARTRLQRFTTNEYLETHGYSGAEKIIEKFEEEKKFIGVTIYKYKVE